jgi:putative SOS response-associated peptidase YedK
VVVVMAEGERRLVSMTWGLVPPWAEKKEGVRPFINARAETVAQKPAFRDAFFHRPCLVPADGYYEWQTAGARKVPFRVVRPDGSLFALAGIWNPSPGGNNGLSCAILTTAAVGALTELHPRMPLVASGEEEYAAWLEGDRRTLLRPYPGPLAAYRVSTAVNSPRLDAPELIEPVT